MRDDVEESKRRDTAIEAIKNTFPILSDCSIRYDGTAKHVFSHRIHHLTVCSAKVNETISASLTVDDYSWWSAQQIREFGTTTWLLLMIKTAKRAIADLKKIK